MPWKAYQEDIDGKTCPLSSSGLYAAKHNPMIFFQDVTNNNDPNSSYCIAHVRPFSELATDLSSGNVTRYNFITPNLCNDMHGNCLLDRLVKWLHLSSDNSVKQGDHWLARNLPNILNSSAYRDGGAVFITWDEDVHASEETESDKPIGLIVLSPLTKGNGYSNYVRYDHSSLLRTLQEIFNASPLLRNAATATDLSDFFRVVYSTDH